MKSPERLNGVVEPGGAPALLLQPADDVEVQLSCECALLTKKAVNRWPNRGKSMVKQSTHYSRFEGSDPADKKSVYSMEIIALS